MFDLLYSRKAKNDLLDLWLWVANGGGVTSADAVLARIETRIAALRSHPELGPARPAIALTARMLVIERWLVLYEFDDAHARIVRIVDGPSIFAKWHGRTTNLRLITPLRSPRPKTGMVKARSAVSRSER